MKLSRWIALVLIVLIIGTAAFLGLRHFSVHNLSAEAVAPVATGSVTFRFLECAGKRSVFILDNQTSEPIYARVERVDFWPEYRAANIQYGVHIVKYKSANATAFVDRSDRFDAPPAFTTISPYTNIRYGVDLREQDGLYTVMVPYIETKDVDLVNRMKVGIQALTKDDFKRLETVWKEAWSETAVTRCK